MIRSSRGPWRLAEPRIRIAPSLLAADFGRLKDDIAAIEAGGAEILHLDVMDGHFVPNISFGVPVIERLRALTRLLFDTHLMISDPMRYASAFVKAGGDHLTFHIETVGEPLRVIEEIRSLGASVGVTLNPATPAEAIQPILNDVDMVLVMSVWPGFGGQTFMPESLEKVRVIRPRLRADQRLEIDGGIGPKTIAAAAMAGADTFVAGSAVFGSGNPTAEVPRLAELARLRSG